MKNFYLIFAGFILLSLQLKAQAPNFLNYQGVARDASGIVLPNQNISLRFTIHQGSAGGTVVYKETQSATTNLLGLFSVAIGNGTVLTGTIGGIAWNANAEYLQVEMDPTGGSTYANMGTTQFLSVPYAFAAGSSSSSWNLTGNSSTNSSSYIGTTDANDLVLKTDGNENVRISNSTGNVGINTPSAKNILDVNGSEAIGTYAGMSTAPSNGLIVSGQVGIGTNNPNTGAALDITSNSQGLLIPRLSANPASPSQGMMYYNTSTGCFMYYTGTMWDAMVCPCPNNPATPGAISGATSFCSGTTGVVYSIAPVSNATSYLWTVPAATGTITAGQGSTAITVTMGTTTNVITVAGVNNCGTGSTSTLGVTVDINPGITTSPANQNVVSGNTAIFMVSATGLPITYQWQVNTGSSFAAIPGATNSTYTTPATTVGMSGYSYNVIVTGPCAAPVTSGAATLTVCPGTPATPGAISGPTTFCPGTTGVVYSVASVTFATTYTWSVPAGTTITNGAGTNSITVTSGSTSGNITVTAGNVCVTSSPSSLALTAGVATAISTQPPTQSVTAPTAATFTPAATGSNLTYQWQLNTGSGYSPISGATNLTYTTPATTTGMDDYLYQIVVTGTCGTVTSNPATLSVCSGSPTSVQITVYNPTVTVTPAGLQVKVSPINFSSYTGAGLNTNLNNVEFSTGPNGTGTMLYAWIESPTAPTATTTEFTTTPTSVNATAAIVWVNLGALTIPAGGSVNIYMSFAGSTIMTGTTGFTGMAPQLTSPYGQLDNGALVFGASAFTPGVYDNFASTTLNSSIWNLAAGCTVTLNNAITGMTCGGHWYGIYTNTFTSGLNTVADAYLKSSSVAGIGIDILMINLEDEFGGNSSSTVFGSGGTLTGSSGANRNGGGSTVATDWYVFTGQMTNSPAATMSLNYTLAATYNQTGGNITNGGIGLGVSGSLTPTIQWFRDRVLPPSGTMPTVTLTFGCF